MFAFMVCYHGNGRGEKFLKIIERQAFSFKGEEIVLFGDFGKIRWLGELGE